MADKNEAPRLVVPEQGKVAGFAFVAFLAIAVVLLLNRTYYLAVSSFALAAIALLVLMRKRE